MFHWNCFWVACSTTRKCNQSSFITKLKNIQYIFLFNISFNFNLHFNIYRVLQKPLTIFIFQFLDKYLLLSSLHYSLGYCLNAILQHFINFLDYEFMMLNLNFRIQKRHKMEGIQSVGEDAMTILETWADNCVSGFRTPNTISIISSCNKALIEIFYSNCRTSE